MPSFTLGILEHTGLPRLFHAEAHLSSHLDQAAQVPRHKGEAPVAGSPSLHLAMAHPAAGLQLPVFLTKHWDLVKLKSHLRLAQATTCGASNSTPSVSGYTVAADQALKPPNIHHPSPPYLTALPPPSGDFGLKVLPRQGAERVRLEHLAGWTPSGEELNQLTAEPAEPKPAGRPVCQTMPVLQLLIHHTRRGESVWFWTAMSCPSTTPVRPPTTYQHFQLLGPKWSTRQSRPFHRPEDGT